MSLTRSERAEKASQQKMPPTRAHAGMGIAKKRRKVVFGAMHVKNEITAYIAPKKKFIQQ